MNTHESEMREAFVQRAEQILSEEERFVKPEGMQRMGFESELAFDVESAPLDAIEPVRNMVIDEVGTSADTELGVAQIEIRTPPIDILKCGGMHELGRVYQQELEATVIAARRHGAHILRVGAHPFLPVLGTPRTHKPKYRQVPDFYNAHRRCDVETRIGLGNVQIDIGDAAVVSLFQSFQVNIEARSFYDAILKMDRSLMIAPYLLTLGGNARYLNCTDSHYTDLRMVAWEKSHDTRANDMRLLSWERTCRCPWCEKTESMRCSMEYTAICGFCPIRAH
ncbi:MAG: hypothetical protein KGI50_00530 [Patescibacteria group bacterium]|nr:hypothetical protein [Patescibacteria group bacterium]MDE2438158.1 hypothetical protein [Patescibacteria group bacterium]